MESLRLTIEKVFKGAGKSFYRFPAAIVSAIIISIVAIVKITMGWEMQQSYSFLFDSIQIAFLLGAAFSMAVVAFDEIRSKGKKSFYISANILGILLASVSFLLLYFYGGNLAEDKTLYLTSIAIGRVSVAIFVSVIAFIYIMSRSKRINNFSDSFFIIHRAYIVSVIYGLVIMIGVSGVLGAFGALVYKGMDYRIYQYLGVVVGFLTYIIFLGYFPNFREEDQEEVDYVKEQPRFIFVLFDYILIPTMIALTVVLLIWSISVIFKGVDASFYSLSGIASSYIMVGIWLHIMVANHETKLADFYKKFYPITGILILAFEAWALFIQIREVGLMTPEYSFLMLWIFALISLLMLIVIKDRAYRKIAITGVVIAIIWVLPFVGYQDITFNSQIKRLEQTLINDGFLVNDQIVAADGEVEHEKRKKITELVNFISYSEKENMPNWFAKDLNDGKIFKDTFGFQKTYGRHPGESDYSSAYFRLETDVVDIRDYSLSLNINRDSRGDYFREFELQNTNYEMMVDYDEIGIPKITVKSGEKIIIEKDMSKYLLDLISEYPLEESSEMDLAFEEMHMILQGEDLSVLVVFNAINAYEDKRENRMDYNVEFDGIYIREE